MRACEAHLELVFGMFSDPGRAWEAATTRALGAPVLEGDFDGTHHVLYRVDDPAATAALSSVLEDKKIYIADGHHRYETMCTFRDELAAAGKGEVARWGLIFLSNLDDPGLGGPADAPTDPTACPASTSRPRWRRSSRSSPSPASRCRPTGGGARAPGRSGGERRGVRPGGAGQRRALVVLSLRPDFDPGGGRAATPGAGAAAPRRSRCCTSSSSIAASA